MDTVSTDLLSLLSSGATPCTRTPSRLVCWCQAHTGTSLPALPRSGTPPSWLSTSPESSCQRKGSFRYLLQQLRNSFANVKISKIGELIHLALSLSITLIVRFIDVKQSSFRLWSINLVSGNILLPFLQVQLGSQLAPAPLPAALVVHLEVFPLRVECSRQVEKVAVHNIVGPPYKVLKNCLLQACDVFDVNMIQIWTFPAAPSTERVPSLAERVA